MALKRFINYDHANKWAIANAGGPCSVMTRANDVFILLAFPSGKRHIVARSLVGHFRIAQSVGMMSQASEGNSKEK